MKENKSKVIDTDEFLKNFDNNPQVQNVLREICEHTPTSKMYNEVLKRNDVLEKRIRHLLSSKWIGEFDRVHNGEYARDIRQADIDDENIKQINMYMHDVLERVSDLLMPIRLDKKDKLDRHGKRIYEPCNISKHDIYRRISEAKLILTESDIEWIYLRAYEIIKDR